jgi:hypothetical protein
MNVVVDPKRTVPARTVTVFEADGSARDGIDAQPGDCQKREPYRGDLAERLMFACPGCARWGSIVCGHPKPAKGPSWDIVSGSLDDPATLTLATSIHCVGCCGWHGYLRNGVFESC